MAFASDPAPARREDEGRYRLCTIEMSTIDRARSAAQKSNGVAFPMIGRRTTSLAVNMQTPQRFTRE